ncbi:MAG: nucleotide sugar dehydrogenase, partial [Deltaproteobacteria bacterium]|nr:nucleotide sugar dehydrogenase [Candidatus Zymogenaceae bacterium]
VQRLINTRSERMMHYPGAGVGGHCLPKDTWLLLYGLSMYGKHEVDTHFVQRARAINESMPFHLFELLEEALNLKGRKFPDVKVAVLGVAYLENSGDTRNTPTYALVDRLTAYGADIITHDPYVTEFPEARLTHDIDEALRDADALVIMTKHSHYISIDLDAAARAMRTRIIIDGRDTFSPENARAAGFFYRAIGKGTH